MPTEMFYTVSRKIMEDDFRGFWAEQNVQHHGANLNNSFQTIATLDGTSLATKRFDFSAFSQLMLAAQHGLGVWPDWGDPPHIQSRYRSTDVKLTRSWCVTCCLPNPQGATCVHGAWVVQNVIQTSNWRVLNEFLTLSILGWNLDGKRPVVPCVIHGDFKAWRHRTKVSNRINPECKRQEMKHQQVAWSRCHEEANLQYQAALYHIE